MGALVGGDSAGVVGRALLAEGAHLTVVLLDVLLVIRQIVEVIEETLGQGGHGCPRARAMLGEAQGKGRLKPPPRSRSSGI